MIAQNRTIQKFTSSLLIISILMPTVLLFSGTKKAEAIASVVGVPVNDFPAQIYLGTIAASTPVNTSANVKSWMQTVLEGLLKVAAKRLLAQMTQATVNWINSGFHGSPLFIENPGAFFKDIAKSEVRNLVDMIGYDTFRFPFGQQTALNVIDSYKRQLSDNAQYTLSKVINDPDLLVRYRNDFNYGGWNGFLINTQYPQNNYLGFQGIIQQNLASRLEGTLQAPAQRVQSLLQQGMGFLSPQMCADNGGKNSYNNGYNEFNRPSFTAKTKYAPPSGDNPTQADYAAADNKYQTAVTAERTEWEKTNTCKNLVSTTPGSVAANQIFNALDTPRESTTLAGELGNSVVDSVAAIFDALINKLLDTGLSALSGAISGTPPEDNWSYNGVTLSGGTSTYNTLPPLNIPQNVSLNISQTTSTPVSGGTAPYTITSTPNFRVATAKISTSSAAGYTLEVTGVGPGTTTLTVQDSSTSCPQQSLPGACIITVTISVNLIGVLAVTPASVIAVVSTPVITNISGGIGNYSILVEPDPTVAVANLAGNNLIVTGVNPGSTFVDVKDSSTPVKTVRVNVIISTTTHGALNIQQNIPVITGTSVNSMPITGGTAPYIIVAVTKPEIATAVISGTNNDTLTITGKKQGETQIMVKDSSQQALFDTTSIIVTDPLTISQTYFINHTNCGTNYYYNSCTGNLTIMGGSGNYSIVPNSNQPDSRIATAQIVNGKTLQITTYQTIGSTSVTIKDSGVPAQTFTVNISVYQ